MKTAARLARLVVLLACAVSVPNTQAQSAYDQLYRPQVHFSPREHWTNDPNGLVYFQGEYHLFFQFNPFGDEWGHMSWGHAVSKDLLHWQELPVALAEKDGEMIFTGSVVVDEKNSSGFCLPSTACLVAIYTGHSKLNGVTRQVQNIAYSRDSGRTWTRYASNPVLDLRLSDFRDPSVFWEEQAHRWLMTVALSSEHKVRFYSSPNLKEWTHLSDFGPAGNTSGAWECPDLLQIPGEQGAPGMWALKVGINPGAPQGGSGEQYFLGNFDGKTFAAASEPGSHGWTNYGKDDYCAISYNGLPKDEKPILIGWMNNWDYAAKLPTSPWRGQMSIPRRLSLVKDAAGYALVQFPVIDKVSEDLSFVTTKLGPLNTGRDGNGTRQLPFMLDVEFDRVSGQQFGIRIYSDDEHWTEIGFDQPKGEFYIDRSKSGAAVAPGFLTRTKASAVSSRPYNFLLIADRSSIEAFAQNGTIAMTDLVFPNSEKVRIETFATNQNSALVKARLTPLRTIWK